MHQRPKSTGKSLLNRQAKVCCAGFLLAYGTAHAMAPVYFDIVGLIEIVALLVVAIVLGAAYAIGRWKGVMVAAIIGGAAIGSLIFKMSLEAQTTRSLNDWRQTAWKACEEESLSLPKIVEATSVVDNTTSLTRKALIQLLTERSLEFVEVKIAEEPLRAKAIFAGDCCDGGWIKAEWVQKPFVRMKLGKASDATCRPELTDPSWQAAPFFPDTCLLAEELDQPSAAVRIEALGAKQTEPRAQGWVRLVDVKSKQVLGELTSSEQGGYGYIERLSRPADPPRSPDCRVPHRMLADLLHNPHEERAASRLQRLSEVEARPSLPLDEILARASTWPKLEGLVGQHIFLSVEQNSQIFNSENWASSVEGARNGADRVGPDGPRLIDLKTATLNGLDLGQSGFLNWRTSAALNGYFVTNQQGPAGERLLARFDRQGKLEWVVNLVFQIPPSIEQGAAFGFQKAVVEGRELVLYDHGRVANGHVATMALRIPLERLPRIAGYR